MTDIFLLRHGKSDWNTEVEDFHRPLTNRGKRAAERIGSWMKSQGIVPDLVWSSPAKRALETAQKAIKVIGLPETEIVTKPALYEADLNTLLEILDEAKQQSGRILIVGHNPSMELVLETLVADQLPETEDGKVMPTATLAHLQMDGNHIRLNHLIRAKTLPKLFAVPTSEGLTYTERPAYYFQQSGVLPYQWHDGELQVLLIRKMDKTEWDIPKGIIEPGDSAMVSATKEALKKAGIHGELEFESLGQYQHKKWGGICDITVYPMLVTELLEEAQWASDKFQRQWLTMTEAKQQTENEDIRDMLKLLNHRLQS